MAVCTKAKELLLELTRSEWLPPYNEDSVRQISQEVHGFHKQVLKKLQAYEDDIAEHPAEQCNVLVSHQCLMRNKRTILAYLNHRVNKIKELRWQTGSVVPEHLAPALCTREMQFFHGYDQLLAGYMSGFGIDLAADLQPPKDLFIEVRVLKDCGEIYTENGAIHLRANSTHFLRRTDVEGLIRQGMLVQIKH
ncbi:DNA replication complex GINS protein PSF1 [Thraustotheca clavata]|uniref:DNA replication complex GINS protein PSF1 n=1 Tax=Thraustotheca clavata TaxID=74557 RepID=A0A1V9Z6Q0_9STRA|nr:DNA replication complex GINS protein PSF1 [Thraustotheca clavata]